jgi:hypothetical protein
MVGEKLIRSKDSEQEAQDLVRDLARPGMSLDESDCYDFSYFDEPTARLRILTTQRSCPTRCASSGDIVLAEMLPGFGRKWARENVQETQSTARAFVDL